MKTVRQSSVCRHLLVLNGPSVDFNIIFQNNDEKVPVAQYVKNLMTWNCTEDHSNMVIQGPCIKKNIFSYKDLLLTEFKGRTVSYGLCFLA